MSNNVPGESRLVSFARRYGWRAYAIPVLVVLTVWFIVDMVVAAPSGTTGTAANPTAVVMDGPDPNQADIAALPGGVLPDGGAYTVRGDGTYRTVGRPGPVVGQGTKHTFTYVVQVENGVVTDGYGGDDGFATMIDATLANPKGWINDPQFAFQHVTDADNPDLVVQLSSLDTTHAACGRDIEMETSCFTSVGNRVILNESRWVRGTSVFQGDLGAYRQYMINHEVGHGIGFAQHDACTVQGGLAPIMMQQTLSANNSELHSIDPTGPYPDDGKMCAYNPWPFPNA
ncbi:MAG: DUF3152 domain-containing protein [Corynebacterium sp.]|nr:DUF3152 domain-containing protein [Corynebacterium sp.]